MREALADAMTSEERVGFRTALDRVLKLERKLVIAAHANSYVAELGASQ